MVRQCLANAGERKTYITSASKSLLRSRSFTLSSLVDRAAACELCE